MLIVVICNTFGNVTVDKKGSVASLKRYRKFLKKVLDFKSIVLPPSPRRLARYFLQVSKCVTVPTAKRFNHERLEEYSGTSAILKMVSVLRLLSFLVLAAGWGT